MAEILNKDFLRTVQACLDASDIITNPNLLYNYGYDASQFLGIPSVVLLPRTAGQVVQIMRAANVHNVSLIPRGAGTNISGGTIPLKGEAVICLTRMNRILEVDPVRERAIVEPGITNIELQKVLEAEGFMFAPDPGSMNVATIGGHVGENAGGMRGVKYGLTRDHILGLEMVDAAGQVYRLGEMGDPFRLTSFIRRANLVDLIVGSEGTLGVVTRVMVKLTRKPRHFKTVLCSFDSLSAAGKAVSAIIEAGIVPTAMEIIDKRMTRAIDDFVGLGLPNDTDALLLVEVDGNVRDMDVIMQLIGSILEVNRVQRVTFARDNQERDKIWLARRSVNGALGRLAPYYIAQDVTVPRHRIAEIIQKVGEIGEKYGLIIALVAHAGDGNLHPHFLFRDREKEWPVIEEASREIFEETVRMEGVLSGEHGIGLEKRAHLDLLFSGLEREFFMSLKTAFDPGGRVNPEKAI